MPDQSAQLMDSYKSKNVLITGGCGFLGSNLAQRLVRLGARVTVLDNMNPMYGGNKFNLEGIIDDIQIVIADVRDETVLTSLIKDMDIVFHFAAQVSYIDSLSMAYEDMDLNAKATLRLLEVARRNNRKVKILFSSSRMVLGKIQGNKIAEDAPTNPLSMYGIHKLTSEKYLIMYYKDFGIPSIVLRITNPYGPRQQIKHSKYSLVGWFVRQAIEGKAIKIFGDGKQLRDYVYVDDIVEAFVRCGIEPKAVGEIINVGSGIGTEFQYMVHKVVETVKNGKIEYVPWPNDYERIETGDVRVDVSKLENITSWSPTHTLTEGIEKTYDYYSLHYDRYV